MMSIKKHLKLSRVPKAPKITQSENSADQEQLNVKVSSDFIIKLFIFELICQRNVLKRTYLIPNLI